MSHRPSRRDSICEAALDLASEGGNHAVTHQSIDKRLGLAKGSTSYYFRTRAALVGAAVRRLAQRSREAFLEARTDSSVPTIDGAADLIAGQLDLLLTDRRRDVLARYALAVDAAADDELRAALATCLFSVEKATGLMGELGARDPLAAAYNLISLLEGLLFDLTYGPRSVLEEDSDLRTAGLRSTIRLWLEALGRTAL
ncbi:TetR family transcriptional regulator [Rhodococcus sp. OK519]|uniref:TetR/AcrR family transcriptional regulator n=1 Tax=Rhodococcus sp. OK519 TaxID=2135729 RepID=UPI000D345079|nr:TetR family transcriptional regulator [Rhodococcus sp. OK519]